MGSSRASTPAGRKRTAKRAAVARGATGRRSANHTKPATRKPAAKKPTAKKPAAKKRTAKKPVVKRSVNRKPLLNPFNLIALFLVGLLLAGAYLFWFRNSSFVAITEVKVEGIAGPQAEPVAAALTDAAKAMTTLNVNGDKLDAVGARFATVAAVDTQTNFPHGMTITVTERPPVLLVRSGENAVPVAGDGTILAGIELEGLKLPEVEVADAPESGKVSGDALALATVAGAAPTPLRPLITGLSIGGEEGLTVTLEGDIPVYFGDGGRAAERWAATAAVLADPKIKTLTYVDVRVPERPAIGGAAPPEVVEETPAL